MKESKIRVLIVDDTALTRAALKSILESDPSIEVIAEAKDGRDGVRKAFALKPDVITMDLKMPIMDGMEAIQSIMQEMPVPIIVVSTINVEIIVKALSIGAMDFVPITQDMEKISEDLIQKIKIARKVKPLRRMRQAVHITESVPKNKNLSKVIAVGVSTGGPQALEILLAGFSKGIPAAFLVVQHISSGFIEGLVEWLKPGISLDLKVAEDGDEIKPGRILVAPDNFNMLAHKDGNIVLENADPEKQMIYVPSIDLMMKSVSEVYEKDAIGLLMTGMGNDGVAGMRYIKEEGGKTFAQDEETSVIFGMNKAAIEKGYVDKVFPLDHLAGEISKMLF
jgi:two-component system chemotaxis response regulator CheB